MLGFRLRLRLKLCGSSTKPDQTVVEVRSNSDVEIDHQTWVWGRKTNPPDSWVMLGLGLWLWLGVMVRVMIMVEC